MVGRRREAGNTGTPASDLVRSVWGPRAVGVRGRG